MQLSINAKPELIEAVDEARDKQSRSGFISDCIKQSLSGQEVNNKQLIAENKADKATINQLIAQNETQKANYEAAIENSKITQHKLENDLEFFRAQNQQLTDAITQRLLETPKKSLWDRIRGR